MYVGLKMLKVDEVATLTPKTLVVEAEKLMVAHRLWMMLVTDGGKLVGYVRKEDVLEALPSRATTLSRHELNYVLSKLMVEKIMRTDVPSMPPDTEIEACAHFMQVEDLAGVAVVGANKKLLGYINRSVMLDVLVEEMGLHQGGSRIVFEVVDRPGVINEVSGIIKEMGISIIATGTFYHDNRRMVVFRVQTADPSPIEEKLKTVGYTMVSAADFAAEWNA